MKNSKHMKGCSTTIATYSTLGAYLGYLLVTCGVPIVGTETSRLSRNLQELLRIVDDMLKRGVRLIFIMQGLDIKDLNNPTTKLMLHMFSVMAEHEKSVISMRTKEALRVLKERGVKLGKSVGTIQHSKLDKHRDKIKEWCRLGFPYARQAAVLKVSKRCVMHYVRSRKNYRGYILK
jgi:putative DNA-invertase from lambdoid prophage Rac